MNAVELRVSTLLSGDILWRLGMIRSLLSKENGSDVSGHCAALVSEISALPGIGPVAVVEFAALMIPGTPGGDVCKIIEDVPVGPVHAYAMRAFHTGDAT